MPPKPAGFDHGALAVVIPSQNLHELWLVFARHQEGGLQHLQEWHVEHAVAVAVAKAPVGSPNCKRGEAVIILVVVLQPLQVRSDPWVRAVGPAGHGDLPPRHVVGLERQGLKIDLDVVEDRDDGDALVSVVVGPASPLTQLDLGINKDVIVHRVVHHDGHSHTPCLELIDDHLHYAVPGGELIVDPQAVNATGLHQVQLLPYNLPLILVVEPQVALIVGITHAPVVIQARRPNPQKPRHVVHHILRAHFAVAGPRVGALARPAQTDGAAPKVRVCPTKT